ncbi:MAG: hypothetical protein AABZ53_15810 [Planctomycetota bacterium]
MDSQSLQLSLNEAVAEGLWVRLVFSGCRDIVIQPSEISDSGMGSVLLQGTINEYGAYLLNLKPPSDEETNQGAAMQERIRAISKPSSKVTVNFESVDVKAIILYRT